MNVSVEEAHQTIRSIRTMRKRLVDSLLSINRSDVYFLLLSQLLTVYLLQKFYVHIAG